MANNLISHDFPARLHQRAKQVDESTAPETPERPSVTRSGASGVILLVEAVITGLDVCS